MEYVKLITQTEIEETIRCRENGFQKWSIKNWMRASNCLIEAVSWINCPCLNLTLGLILKLAAVSNLHKSSPSVAIPVMFWVRVNVFSVFLPCYYTLQNYPMLFPYQWQVSMVFFICRTFSERKHLAQEAFDYQTTVFNSTFPGPYPISKGKALGRSLFSTLTRG